MITLDQLSKFSPSVPSNKLQPLLDAINACIVRFDLSTSRRLRYFITHTSFETMGYTTWSENLNYSTPERLCTVWPKVFSMDIGDRLTPNLPDYALDYVNNPQKLANTVYASNYGNGDAASGDGFNFRGQGGIHLTFRSNYLACSKYLFTDDRLVTNPLLIQDVSVAMLSAGWFWDIKKINKLADSDSFTQSTKVINGSEASAPDRLKVLNIANTIFI